MRSKWDLGLKGVLGTLGMNEMLVGYGARRGARG